MQFTIQREAFLKSLKAVAGVVERRHMQLLPILSNVLIDITPHQFSLTTTDQEVEVIASGEISIDDVQPGKITVPLRKLMDICRALSDGSLLTLSEKEDRVILRSGRGRFSLSTLPADQFPALAEASQNITLELPGKDLKRLIDSTSFAMAEQDVRYYFNGMLFELKDNTLCTVASDGHRLAQAYVKITQALKPGQSFRVIVPRKGILELQRVLEEGQEQVQLILGPQHLRLRTKQISLTTKLLEGRFPDYERIIPQNGDKIVVAGRNLLKDAFLRAAALFSDKTRGVRLRLNSGCLNILASNAEQDEVEEDLEIDYKGQELEIGFNIKYLLDFLSIISDDLVKFTFSDAKSSVRVEGVGQENGVYVIMPMRI